MKVIWKYVIQPHTIFDLSAPPEGRVVHFDTQYGEPTFWFEFTPGDHCVPRKFQIFGTGRETIPDHAVHCGTTYDDEFVWHLYELKDDTIRVHWADVSTCKPTTKSST